MKLLITGATGFVGKNFIFQLHKKYKITALVRKTSNTAKIQDYCKIYHYDGDVERLIEHCQKEKFDGIIHLATLWISQHQIQDIHPLVTNNITFGIEMLEVSKRAKIAFFINTSSFGLYCNSLEYRPSSLYAATKKAFEDIVSYYALTSQTIFSHLLIYNTYGPNDNTKRLFSLLAQIAKSGEELKMSDGTQLVDITHIDDIIYGFDCLIQELINDPDKCKNKIYALKNPSRIPLKKVVQTFEEVYGKRLNILWGAREPRELEILTPWKGGEQLPSWKPKISLQNGIKTFIDTLQGGGAINEKYHTIYLHHESVA